MARKRVNPQDAASDAKKRRGEDAAAAAAAPPGESLYLKNLNDQVSISDLRTALYMLFSAFGHVVAVNAHKSPRMRGQAHVAFANSDAAAQALAALQGRRFLSKTLVIAYAKRKSDRAAWLQRDLDA